MFIHDPLSRKASNNIVFEKSESVVLHCTPIYLSGMADGQWEPESAERTCPPQHSQQQGKSRGWEALSVARIVLGDAS